MCYEADFMTRLQIDFPDNFRQRLGARARAAGFATIEEYASAVIQADATDPGAPVGLSFRNDTELEEFLLQRMEQPDVGEMTDEDFNAIRGRLRRPDEEKGNS
jgi:hypothetical protein